MNMVVIPCLGSDTKCLVLQALLPARGGFSIVKGTDLGLVLAAVKLDISGMANLTTVRRLPRLVA